MPNGEKARRRVHRVLLTGRVEQVALTEPLDAVRRAGAHVALVSRESGAVQMFIHLDKRDTIVADRDVVNAGSRGWNTRAAWSERSR
jgi:protease I